MTVTSDIKFGLALGGGGARGLAHIPVLEALDELGLKPAAISGSSIGAIIGAGYAAGMSGGDIRDHVVSIFSDRSQVISRMWKLFPRKIGDVFAGGLAIGQMDAEKVLNAFLADAVPDDFAELKIPLTVLTTDYYGWHETAFNDGPLRQAVAASMALPSVFRPVTINDRVLIDGGVVNPLPFDVLPEDCDLTLAVDVIAGPEPRHGKDMPGSMDVLFGATQLLMQSIIKSKLQISQPNLLIRPDINAYRVFDFLKAEKILTVNAPVKDEVKYKVEAAIHALEQGRPVAMPLPADAQ